jgi:phosphodiester glycosidase
MKSRTPADKARRRRRRRWIALGVCLVLVLPVVSYVRALLYPGNASFAVRTVEWFRDHGAGAVIDTIETWKYSRQAPPPGGQPQDIPTFALTTRTSVPAPQLPAIKHLPGVPSLPREGQWTPARQGSHGRTLLWASWFRPDRAHLPVTVAAALIPQTADRVRLMPGTREPVVGMASRDGYSVPAKDRANLVATFNAGFKMQDSHGGWWTTESHAVPLVDGRASAVIDTNGTVRIGAWNETVRMGPDVVAVRQNLDLVIAGGKIVNGLTSNANGRWGSVRSQFQYTWRSGLGTDANGNLIYVAGRGLTLGSLATAMQQAGIQEGMELDIHAAMVSFDVEYPQRNGQVSSKRLLDSMTSPANRYLVDDQRDYFSVMAR